MTDEAPKPRLTARETAIFYAKLIGFLLALTVFGFVVFLLTKQLHIGRTH
jgi:ATP/ADP translocase